MGIGANDAANAFASSVGSKALTAQGIYSPILKNQIACNNNSSIIYI